MPGSGYSLSETVPGGWDQTGATCNDGSPVSNINVVGRRDRHLHLHEPQARADRRGARRRARRRAGLLVHGRWWPVACELLARRRPRRRGSRTAARSTTCRSGPGTRSRRACRPAGISRAPPATTAAPCRTSACRTGRRSPVRSRTTSAVRSWSSRTPRPTTRRTSRSPPAAGCHPPSFSLDDDANGTLSNSRTFTDVPAGNGYSLERDRAGRLGPDLGHLR